MVLGQKSLVQILFFTHGKAVGQLFSTILTAGVFTHFMSLPTAFTGTLAHRPHHNLQPLMMDCVIVSEACEQI